MTQAPSLRIGIEEEYQIVDPETRNLRFILTRTAEQSDRCCAGARPRRR